MGRFRSAHAAAAGRGWWRAGAAAVAVVAALGVAAPAFAAPPSQPAGTPAQSDPSLPPAMAPITAPQANKPAPGPNPDGPVPTAMAHLDQTSAAAIARRTGKPVEVTASTTATHQVVANPDGTFTMTSNRRPVRARRGNGWVPVDTALHRTAGGGLAPAATTEDVTFSGGGTGPLVTLTQDGRSLAFTWPTPLPAPVVSGPTATYPGVLPGVDLRMAAESDGYREVLVVHDAAAAANPALAHLHLGVTATGLTLRADADGGLVAVDQAGATVFQGAKPRMWDSRSVSGAGPAPSADDPGTGRVTPLPAAVSGAGPAYDVGVDPSPAALTGPNVTYPVYIDPQLNRGEEYWVEVTQNGWAYYNANQLAQVGACYQDGTCAGLSVARSFFRMGTEDISGHPNGTTATVFWANFYADEVWGAHDCSSEPVGVALAGPIDGGTVWPGPDGNIVNTQWSAAGQNCPPGPQNVVFDVTSTTQTAANNGWANETLELKAPDEGNQFQWKKFSDNPTLVANYSYPPNAPYGLGVSHAVTCTSTTYTSDAYPTFYAAATDNNNPPLNPTLHYQLLNQAGGQVSTGTATVGSGTTGQWTDPVALDQEGFQLRVTTSTNDPQGDPTMWASAGASYNFSHLTAPTQAPVLFSYDYPQGYWGQPSDNPSQIFFNANGAANIAGFTWSLSGAGTEPAPPSSECNYNQAFGSTSGYTTPGANGWGQVTLPQGLSVGYHTMSVRSFDLAHNLSPESALYTFYVAPPAGGTGGWYEAESLPTTEPAGETVPLGSQGNCCGVSWTGGAQLLFQGTASGQSFGMTVNAPVAGNYDLAANLTTAPDYGQVSFTMDGKSLGLPTSKAFDGYSAAVARKYVAMGGTYLTAGSHTLTETVVGTNPATTGKRYMAGIDTVYLKPSNHLEGEAPQEITPTDTSGANITPVAEANDNGTSWRGDAQLLYPGTAAGQTFTLGFTAPVEADYALGAALTQRANYGRLSFTVDNAVVLMHTDTSPFDAYSATATWKYQPLGGVHLTAGQHKITVKVVDKNASSTGYNAGIDYLSAAPINNVTASSFAAAMNNHGVAADNTTPANFDLAGGFALSNGALSAAGLAPGQSATVAGATFTIAAASAAGYDNVIANGQTIPFPTAQQVRANAIGLLVASTCGATQPAAATVTYTDGTYSNGTVPSVPDWVYGDSNSATTVLSYLDTPSGAPSPARSGKLYTVFVPADPTKTVQKITLPYTGTAQLTNTCTTGGATTTALHVLAMAPRPAAAGALPAGAAGWLGAWAAPSDTATTPPGGAGFANQTIRMVVHPTVAGGSVRIRLSNAGAGLATPPQATPATVTVDAATIAAQAGTTGTGAATLAAPVGLTFGGSAGVTIPAGGEATSDPVAFPATGGGSGNLTVSVHLPTAVTQAPVHANPNTPAYLGAGNATGNSDGVPYATNLAGDYYLSGVEVTTAAAGQGTVAVLGDQTTAIGASSAGRTDQQTWVDDLPALLGSNLPGSVTNVSTAGSAPNDWWKLTDGSGVTAADSSGALPATVNGGVTWSTATAGDVAGSAGFDGATGYLATAGPALNTAASFAVSAWVDPTQLTTAWQTFVIQQSAHNAGFFLEYDGGSGKWSFSRSEADGTNPKIDRSESSAAAQANTWTHLVGVFDVTNGSMTLYVNGVAQTAATDNAPIASTGPVVVGRGYFNGAPGNYVTGSVSDVRVFKRTLTANDIAELRCGTPPGQPAPGAGAPTAASLGTTGALSASPDTPLNRVLLAQPNLRTVIVTAGTDDLLTGASMTTIRSNLTGLISSASTNGYGLHTVFRPDGSPLQVILATIPPLGLAASDPREAARQSLNNDIRANYTQYGADYFIDFDKAVNDSVDNLPNQTAPAYLTNGQPNAAYHQQLAQTLADAVTTFPPTVTL